MKPRSEIEAEIVQAAIAYVWLRGQCDRVRLPRTGYQSCADLFDELLAAEHKLICEVRAYLGRGDSRAAPAAVHGRE